MGKKSAPQVQYVGPSAAEIAQQQAALSQQLLAQQQQTQTGYNQQFQQAQAAYNSQLEALLAQQQQQQAQYDQQLSILREERDKQAQVAQQQLTLIERLQQGALNQESLISTLNKGGKIKAGQTRADLVGQATQMSEAQQARSVYRNQLQQDRGGTIIGSLLRNASSTQLS